MTSGSRRIGTGTAISRILAKASGAGPPRHTGIGVHGLYFDPFNKHRAWVNIQHPDSDNDRTIELTTGRRHPHE
jgi:hypothetical protein